MSIKHIGIIVFWIIACGSLFSTIIHVPSDYTAIQLAIDAAADNDTVLVADGTYHENLKIDGKEIKLASCYLLDGDEDHISNTILDGSSYANPDEASVIAIRPGSHPEAVPWVIGITIQNGHGWKKNDKKKGGGLYIDKMNPIFTKNVIKDNEAVDEGGGAYALGGKPNFGGEIEFAGNWSISRSLNPGGNVFQNNDSNEGKSIFADSLSMFDTINAQNCVYDVFSSVDTDVSNYWIHSEAAFSFEESSGQNEAIVTDVWISPDGNDSNDGSETSPFKTITHALSQVYGDIQEPVTIYLYPGTYSPSTNGETFPLPMVKYVSIIGLTAGTRNDVIINAEATESAPSAVIISNHINNITLDSFTVTGGYSDHAYTGGGMHFIGSSFRLYNILVTGNHAFRGGGIYFNNSGCKLWSGCEVFGNTANWGAGLYFSFSTTIVDSVTIHDNTATNYGGGAYFWRSTPQILNTEIENNNADYGGGCYMNESQPVIIETLFQNNSARFGGGFYCWESDMMLLDSRVLSNTSTSWGAGGRISLCDPILENVIIQNNSSATCVGGLYISEANPIIIGSMISNNSASNWYGGIVIMDSGGKIINSTICNNSASTIGGLGLSNADPIIVNSIIWSNSHSNIGCNGNTSNSLVVSHCDIQGGSSSIYQQHLCTICAWQGCIDTSPCFTDPSNHDYSLQSNSPCIDNGTPYFEWNNDAVVDYSPEEYLGINPDIGFTEFDTEDYPAISIFPESITFWMLPGEISEQTITIFNNGIANLYVDLYSQGNSTFMYDDGTAETARGSYGDPTIENIHYMWMNVFETEQESEEITSVDVSWGCYRFFNEQIEGLPCRIILYDDPNNDYIPLDAVYLAEQETTIQYAGEDIFKKVDFPNIVVNGVFFVAVLVENVHHGPRFSSFDENGNPPISPWVFGTFHEPAFDFMDLSNSEELFATESNGWEGVFLLRADTVPDWLSINSGEMEIPVSDSEELSVTIDASGMQPGQYEKEILLLSNDPDNPRLQIPIYLEICDLNASLELCIVTYSNEVQLRFNSISGASSYRIYGLTEYSELPFENDITHLGQFSSTGSEMIWTAARTGARMFYQVRAVFGDSE